MIINENIMIIKKKIILTCCFIILFLDVLYCGFLKAAETKQDICNHIKNQSNEIDTFSLKIGVETIYEACENLEKFYESVGWKYSEEAEPGYHIVKHADPIFVPVPEFVHPFSRDIQQWVVLKRIGSLKVVTGNLPYFIKLVPAILLRFKACK